MRPFLPSTPMRACSMAARSPAAAMPASSSCSRACRSAFSATEVIRAKLHSLSSSALCRGPKHPLAPAREVRWVLGTSPRMTPLSVETALSGGLLRLLDGLGSLLGQRLEALSVRDGEIGQNLAVDGDPGLVQTVDKSAVGHAVLAYSRVDALNPESAERALLGLA